MDILWFIWETGIIVIDAVLFLYLLHSKLRDRPFRWWVDILFIAADVTLIYNLNQHTGLYSLALPAAFVLRLAYSLFYKRGHVFSRVYWPSAASVVSIAANFFIQIIVAISPRMTVGDFEGLTETRFQLMLLYMLFSAAVIRYLARKPSHTGSLTPQLQRSMLGISFFAIAICGVLLDFAPVMESSSLIFVIMSLALLGVIVSLLLFFEHLGRKSEEADTLRQELFQTLIEQRFNEHIEEMYETMRGWRHDFHNHLQTLAVLCRQGDYEELSDYLNMLEGEMSSMYTFISTGNRMVDAVLTSKMLIAQNRGINADMQVQLPSPIPMPVTALCTLLGNLLDNAIEACDRLPQSKRIIILHSRIEKGMWKIFVKNTCDGIYVIEDNVLLTRKADDSHGQGVRRIGQIVKEAGGNIDFQPMAEWFEVTILLPCIPH